MDYGHAANIVRLGPRVPVPIAHAEAIGTMESIANIAVPNRVIEARSTETTSSSESTSSCGANACEKSVNSSSFTMPIVLGVA
jgi:hypothetical protein